MGRQHVPMLLLLAAVAAAVLLPRSAHGVRTHQIHRQHVFSFSEDNVRQQRGSFRSQIQWGCGKRTVPQRFLHITDIHLDLHYVTGASTATACHRPPDNTHGDSFAVAETANSSNNGPLPITSASVPTDSSPSASPPPIPLSHSFAPPFFQSPTTRRHLVPNPILAGPYGTPTSPCDSPHALVNLTFDFVAQHNQDEPFAFVIWTGDNARHDADKTIPRSWEEVKKLNRLVTEKMITAFPDTPVIPSIGNNDIIPHNVLDYPHGKPNEILQYFGQLWGRWIPDDQVSTWNKLGCFWRQVTPQIIAVSFNTLYVFNSNSAVSDCSHVPSAGASAEADKAGSHSKSSHPGDEMFAWLEHQVLRPARISGNKVILSGHVPPSPLNYYPNCFLKYAHLAQAYDDVLLGGLYGHMNVDHFFFAIKEMLDQPRLRNDELSTVRLPSLNLKLNDDEFDNNSGDFTVRNVLAEKLHSLAKSLRLSSLYYADSVATYIDYLLNQFHVASQIAERKGKHTRPLKNLTLPGLVFVAPSVVPAFNPAVRMYDFESKKGNYIIRYTQWFLNLTEYNSGPMVQLDIKSVAPSSSSVPPRWEIEYTTEDDYLMSTLDNSEYVHVMRQIAGICDKSFMPSDQDESRWEHMKKKRKEKWNQKICKEIKERFLKNLVVGTNSPGF